MYFVIYIPALACTWLGGGELGRLMGQQWLSSGVMMCISSDIYVLYIYIYMYIYLGGCTPTGFYSFDIIVTSSIFLLFLKFVEIVAKLFSVNIALISFFVDIALISQQYQIKWYRFDIAMISRRYQAIWYRSDITSISQWYHFSSISPWYRSGPASFGPASIPPNIYIYIYTQDFTSSLCFAFIILAIVLCGAAATKVTRGR